MIIFLLFCFLIILIILILTLCNDFNNCVAVGGKKKKKKKKKKGKKKKGKGSSGASAPIGNSSGNSSGIITPPPFDDELCKKIIISTLIKDSGIRNGINFDHTYDTFINILPDNYEDETSTGTIFTLSKQYIIEKMTSEMYSKVIQEEKARQQLLQKERQQRLEQEQEKQKRQEQQRRQEREQREQRQHKELQQQKKNNLLKIKEIVQAIASNCLKDDINQFNREHYHVLNVIHEFKTDTDVNNLIENINKIEKYISIKKYDNFVSDDKYNFTIYTKINALFNKIKCKNGDSLCLKDIKLYDFLVNELKHY
jgi:hypothetical protein